MTDHEHNTLAAIFEMLRSMRDDVAAIRNTQSELVRSDTRRDAEMTALALRVTSVEMQQKAHGDKLESLTGWKARLIGAGMVLAVIGAAFRDEIKSFFTGG